MLNQTGEVMNSMLWKASEKGVIQIVRLVFEVVMARLLSPNDFGTFTLLLTFVTLSNIAIEGGLGSALIQTKNLEDGDTSTVLLISEGVALALYTLIYFAAPLLATFYNIVGFERYLRIMGLSVFISSINSVQNSVAMRTLNFKSLFLANTEAIVFSVVVGIGLASIGFGLWALVIQYMLQVFVGSIAMMIMSSAHILRSGCKFSLRRAYELFSFGWKIMVSNLLNRGYGEIYNMFVGKVYSPATLGLYGKGKMIPLAFENGLTSVVTTVMLPVMSRQQGDVSRVKKSLGDCVRMLSFIVTPLFFGLAATCDTFVTILLTDKWLAAASIMRIIAIGVVLQPLNHVSTTAINAIGRSDIVLKLEVNKRIIGLALLGIALLFDIEAVAVALSLSYVINLMLNCMQTYRLFGYSFSSILKDILPAFSCSFVMATIVYSMSVIPMIHSIYTMFSLQIIAGVILYYALSYYFNKDTLNSFMILVAKRWSNK